MNVRKRGRGVSLVELLMALFIRAILTVLFMPATRSSRDATRRAVASLMSHILRRRRADRRAWATWSL